MIAGELVKLESGFGGARSEWRQFLDFGQMYTFPASSRNGTDSRPREGCAPTPCPRSISVGPPSLLNASNGQQGSAVGQLSSHATEKVKVSARPPARGTIQGPSSLLVACKRGAALAP